MALVTYKGQEVGLDSIRVLNPLTVVILDQATETAFTDVMFLFVRDS